MLVPTRTTIAYRCPCCGRWAIDDLSLFQYGSSTVVRLQCECGCDQVVVRKKGTNMTLQIPCLLCNSTHHLIYERTEFWSPELTYFDCPSTGIELGFIGSASDVRQAAAERHDDVETIMEETRIYFDNPDITFSMLSYIEEQAEAGNIVCTCGNYDIEIDVEADRIHLFCQKCGRSLFFMTRSQEDLDRLRQLKRIEINTPLTLYEQSKTKGRKDKPYRRKE